jgi:predicted GH43/DUF377 family glycosyl hydrolase
MQTAPIEVIRRPERLVSDDRRVIPRYLDFKNPKRIRSILRRALRVPEEQLSELLAEVRSTFSHRHRDLEAAFLENFERVRPYLKPGEEILRDRQLLIGAYFTLEYSIESAALFNPSMVMHPNQNGLPAGSVRFLLSLRATGEGHVSSIVFRRGVVSREGDIAFDPPPRYAYRARPIVNKMLERVWFEQRLRERGLLHGPAIQVLERLPDRFTAKTLCDELRSISRELSRPSAFGRAARSIRWLAEANYDVRFPEDCLPSEIVIFPATESERRGMEDLRLTRFIGSDGQVTYYGTYTASGAQSFFPMLIETTDFTTFCVRTVGGRHIKNKGLALFPRKVNGRYLMVSRHDGENLWLLSSDSLHTWNEARQLQLPRETWELVQLGNCGSPLETDRGWVLLTHGVGPVRQYCIGAMLLDLGNPAKVLGRLKQPLMVPTAEEREGYVPNVVYSCGSMIHGDRLIMPYAMSDLATGFATVSATDLVEELLRNGP